MSMVFQHFGLLPHKTVLENAAYALRIRGISKAEARQKGREWLEVVGLAGYENSYPKQLSGGEQQRVGLARALAADTDIILMDEAFSALDPLIRSQMQEQLMALQEKLQKTIVFITHDLIEALRIGSRIAILNDGKVAQIGTPEEILNQPADDYVKDFIKDVNRASVLNVEALMTQPKLTFENETLSEALSIMRSRAQPWAWVCSHKRLSGLLTLAQLEKAIANKPNANIAEIAQATQTFSADDPLEALIPAAIGNSYPVPVLDKKGQLSGVVAPDAIVEAFTQNQ